MLKNKLQAMVTQDLMRQLDEAISISDGVCLGMKEYLLDKNIRKPDVPRPPNAFQVKVS